MNKDKVIEIYPDGALIKKVGWLEFKENYQQMVYRHNQEQFDYANTWLNKVTVDFAVHDIQDIVKWMQQNKLGRHGEIIRLSNQFFFEDESDALAFKLRWV